jgi:hypothetical protein
MKIYPIQQRTPEWFALRSINFTASELGQWALDPVKINLTVDELKTVLDALGIARKGVTKRDDLIDLLPSPEQYETLCDGARTAILGKIKQERFNGLRLRGWDNLTPEERIWMEREEELALQSEKAFSYNIPVKYGNLLEPFARSAYESITGYEVEEVGFCEADGYGYPDGGGGGGLGCSPDGLVKNFFGWSHGIEVKCPVPETHLAWLLDGGLPEVHALQVHCSMAVTELTEWHFFSYCPGETPLLAKVMRDETTERLLAGLKRLVVEKAKIKARLSEIWNQTQPQ